MINIQNLSKSFGCSSLGTPIPSSFTYISIVLFLILVFKIIVLLLSLNFMALDNKFK